MSIAVFLASSLSLCGQEFTQFDFVRERIGHKVIVEATLANPLNVDLTDVRITVIYFDGDRELRRSKPVRLDRIGSGQSESFKIEAEQVQNFDHYDLILEHGGNKKIQYGGNEAHPMPEAKRPPPAKLILSSQTQDRPKTFPGDATLTLAVKNAGGTEAQEPIAAVTLLNAEAVVVRKFRVRLGRSIQAGAEDTFEIVVPNSAEFATAQAALVWVASEIQAPADSAGGSPVEVHQCRVVRLNDGSVRVSGVVKNGLDKGVEKVAVTFQLGKVSHPFEVPGQIRPGAVRDFEFYVPECPVLDRCHFDLSYEEAAAIKEEKAEEPAPTAQRTTTKEGAPPPDAPKPSKETPKPAPPDPKKSVNLTVQVRGVQWIEGFVVNNTYIGDVGFLRLVVRDEEGKPARPAGSLNVIFYEGDNPVKRVARSITRESWKEDAAKIKPQNASHEKVVFDAKAGELWVGVVRSEGRSFSSHIDVILTLGEAGAWTWKKLEDPYEAPPRGADPKKK